MKPPREVLDHGDATYKIDRFLATNTVSIRRKSVEPCTIKAFITAYQLYTQVIANHSGNVKLTLTDKREVTRTVHLDLTLIEYIKALR